MKEQGRYVLDPAGIRAAASLATRRPVAASNLPSGWSEFIGPLEIVITATPSGLTRIAAPRAGSAPAPESLERPMGSSHNLCIYMNEVDEKDKFVGK